MSELTGPYDAESVDTTPPPPGAPVDPPTRPTTFADVTGRTDTRRPIVPAALRSKDQRRTLARWAAGYGAHTTAYHLTRSPKYAAKTALWAPWGLLVTVGKVLRWATAEEGNWALRQAAANRNDPDAWLKLDHARRRSASWRWWVVLAGAVALTAALIALLSGVAPWWARWVALAVAVPALAWMGRPADRPIVDRVHTGPTYRKLTAEIVRRALAGLSIAGINQALAKDPTAITFPREIHRDGPGYLATVDLPYGVEAVEVIDRRGKLASGLRLPLDQVWPEVDPGHTGRLALWVGDEPASQQRQPTWPLLRDGQVDVFAPFPFATDPRLRTVNAALLYRNWLIGAMPGAGKTFALRLLLLAAALDPRVEMHVFELKGSGDLDALEPVCRQYGSGADEDTAEQALGMLRWLRQECGRRAEVVKRMARAGKAPENKVTPQLASMEGLGLHPLIAAVDECQELFSHPDYGKEAGVLATQVIKLGRALGVVLLLATQRPDKDSLPTGVSANVNVRFCLRVMGQTENDMVLGTSMYKNGVRANQFTDKDLGWGWLVGVGDPVAVHGFYVDGPGAARIVARALKLRSAAGTMPDPVRPPRVQVRNLLDDVRQVWPAGETAIWSEIIVPLLRDLDADAYGDLTVEIFGASMAAAGVPTVKIGRRIEGKAHTRAGVRFDELDAGIKTRQITD